ncbi:MAG: hypothetical protein H2069_07340 [Legionella sp.]|nr:hypothetical protein [Legionella sp.]
MSGYKQDKGSLIDFSLFNGAIPKAERWAIVGVAATFAIRCFTQSQSACATIFVLASANYLYQKYKQDMAVTAYYQERQGIDLETNQSTHNRNDLVQALGGKNAIHNACLTQLFCP